MTETIERAVLQWFNISKDELYSLKETYPISGARSVFMYLLFKEGKNFTEIRDLFGLHTCRAVELRVGSVAQGITRNWGRYPVDVRQIERIIEQFKNE